MMAKVVYKVMCLDMFSFAYKPIFNENEKVFFKDSCIVVEYNDYTKQLVSTDVSNVELDTLFHKRVGENWSCSELLSALDEMGSASENNHSLCIIEPEDLRSVSYGFMVSTLNELNYDGQSFSYIAYGE